MENNYDIFKYLKPLENTKLSNFHGYDLQDLISILNKYKLEYRSKLNVSTKASIGCEIEYENKRKNVLSPIEDEEFEIRPGWILREDGSLKKGGEIVSPIFYNNQASWNNFKDFFNVFTEDQCIRSTCSSHVHIGTPFLGSKPKNWNNFLKLWSIYENIIFRFCYGEYLTSRTSINKYAPPIAKKIDDYFKEVQDEYGSYYNENRIMPLKEDIFKRSLKKSRYSAVNLNNVSDLNSFEELNTIEFRVANGTLNPIIWQNLINLYISLLAYSKSSLFDKDIIMKRRSNMENYGDFDSYNDIYYDQAIELCDLIFNKNIDKIYFLRQYLKNNSVSHSDNFIKAKKFTI